MLLLTRESGSKNFGSDESGVAAVEFAIVLPVLMILLFGIIDLGRLFYDFHAVSKSVRDAARFLAHVEVDCPTGGPSSGPLASYIASSTYLTEAQNLAFTGSVATPTASSDYLLSYWTNPSSLSMTVDCIANASGYTGPFTNLEYIPKITVAANVPFNFLFGLIVFSSSSFTFSVSHNEVNVGE